MYLIKFLPSLTKSTHKIDKYLKQNNSENTESEKEVLMSVSEQKERWLTLKDH